MMGGSAAGAAAPAAASTAGGAVASGLGAGGMLPSAALGNSLSGAAQNAASGLAASPLGGAAAAPAATSAPGLLGSLLSSRNMGAFTGAGIGSSLAGPTGKQPDGSPPGFNTPRAPTNPNFNQMLGNNNSSQINFGGYDPVQSVRGPNPGFNFYRPPGT
jgi:hypothetical protein